VGYIGLASDFVKKQPSSRKTGSCFSQIPFARLCPWVLLAQTPNCAGATIPKSNAGFWKRKLAENIERDLRAKQELEKQGWRIMVVWECELSKHTVETIQKVANWLTKRGYRNDCSLMRKELLAIAEKKGAAAYNFV